MNVAIFGGRRIQLPEGWGNQKLVSILGSVNVDARARPAESAKLTIVVVMGGALAHAPQGARVLLSGFTLLGGRRIDVESRADGPEIRVRAYSVMGGVRVTDRL
jgi:hypothetical protein